MKNFVEQISIKFGVFYLIKMNLVQNYVVDKHTKISVKISMEICISADIQKVKYRPIKSVDRYFGRSLVQIQYGYKTTDLNIDRYYSKLTSLHFTIMESTR